MTGTASPATRRRRPDPAPVVNPNGISSLDFFGTVRGRIGYAFDRVLFYGTGGFAYGAGGTERSFGGFRGNDDFRTGYAAGGGIEYALPTDSFLNFFRSSAVTLKVEGLYVNLDRATRNAASSPFQQRRRCQSAPAARASSPSAAAPSVAATPSSPSSAPA